MLSRPVILSRRVPFRENIMKYSKEKIRL